MPRRRAVVMIQPAGLGGRPLSGQRLTASAKASWTASSAASMSPKTRTRTATARPYSARKTRSISAGPGNGADLDRQSAGLGLLAGPAERGVEVGRLDQREAADVLGGL